MPARPVVLALATALAACGGRSPDPVPQPMEHSLAGLAAQHIALLPAYGVRVMPGLDWGSSTVRRADVRQALDADIASALDERGIVRNWILPAQLLAAYKRNTSYAADPYNLAEESLRSPVLALQMRLPEPLASQIRTLVALHDDTRLVLAPADLRFEKAGSGARGVLRLVLIDARASNVQWIGEIPSDTVTTYGPAVTASIAARLANAVSAQ